MPDIETICSIGSGGPSFPPYLRKTWIAIAAKVPIALAKLRTGWFPPAKSTFGSGVSWIEPNANQTSVLRRQCRNAAPCNFLCFRKCTERASERETENRSRTLLGRPPRLPTPYVHPTMNHCGELHFPYMYTRLPSTCFTHRSSPLQLNEAVCQTRGGKIERVIRA